MIGGSDMYFSKGEGNLQHSLSMVMRFSEKAVWYLLLLNTDRKDYSLVLDDGQIEKFVEEIAEHIVQLNLLYWNSCFCFILKLIQ